MRLTIIEAKGSTPRDIGAEMWVSLDGLWGSIGGGNYEAAAVAHARQMLETGESKATLHFTLGPETGQCCGGQITVAIEPASPPSPQKTNLAIFGAGHVGAAIARIGANLPFEISLYDSRPVIEIEHPMPYIGTVLPEAEIEGLNAGDFVLVMTHDHGLDFLITEAALSRGDLGFVGMIGSKSKAARFRSAHAHLGTKLNALHAPIAKGGNDKRPEAIALEILGALYARTNV